MNKKDQCANSLGQLFGEIVHFSMREFHHYARSKNLSGAQLNTLFRIKKKRSCQVKELGSSMDITNAAASQMLDKLVQRGYIKREESNIDRRVKNHTLTNEGEILLKEFFGKIKFINNSMIEEFHEEEYDKIIKLAERLKQKISERRGNDKNCKIH